MESNQDYSLPSLLDHHHDHDDLDLAINMNEVFDSEIDLHTLTQDDYTNSFLESGDRALKDAVTHHSEENNGVVILLENRADEEPEIDNEAFDYSIFLNKPESPKDDVIIDDDVEDVIITEEVVEEKSQEFISEEKVEELLEESELYFGNICKKDAVKLDDGYFHCGLCSLKFKLLSNYRRHRLRHQVQTKKKPHRYQCEICSRNFLQRCDLERHMHVHNNTYPHRCDVCAKGYLRRNDLEVHMNFHRRERKYLCEKCPKAFFSKSDLNRHFRLYHGREDKVKCRQCSRQYSNESMLLQHIQQKHDHLIMSAFKEQVCKLQEIPSLYKVGSQPFSISTMTTPLQPTTPPTPTITEIVSALTSSQTSSSIVTLTPDMSLPQTSSLLVTSNQSVTSQVDFESVTSLGNLKSIV